MEKWLCKRTWLGVAGFADKGRDVKPRKVAYFQELEKENDLSLDPQEGTACRHYDFSPVRPMPDVESTELRQQIGVYFSF